MKSLKEDRSKVARRTFLASAATSALSVPGQLTSKGIVLSLLCGVVMGVFYPFVAKALIGPRHLTPYTIAFIFALGVVVSNFPLNYASMKHPVKGPPVKMGEVGLNDLN